MRDKEGIIYTVNLNVFPFKCNSPQTDDNRSSTTAPLPSFFSETTKERMKRGVGVKPGEKGEKKSKVAQI